MRRSSRIQFKQEGIAARLKAEPKFQRKLVTRKKSRDSSKRKFNAHVHESSLRKRFKNLNEEVQLKKEDGNDGEDVGAVKCGIEGSGEAPASTHELIDQHRDEFNDSDVVNSVKIDRTIKNLSPKKFFINKNGKTTRSGRSFSPYDFASYSLLFGSLWSEGGGQHLGPSAANPVEIPLRVKTETKDLKTKRKETKRMAMKRSSLTQPHRVKDKRLSATRKYRKSYKKREMPCQIMHLEPNPLQYPSFETGKCAEKDDLFSEDISAAFLIDFPPSPVSPLEGHSLPTNFFDKILDTDYFPLTSNYTFDDNDVLDSSRRCKDAEIQALSKISLADADKYGFTSVFKDIQSQMASFENLAGCESPGTDGHKFDLMETQSVEGRRFYRKRITDSRLIAWHKYNLTSSTKYSCGNDPPPPRPVIKVRSNPCQRADMVWRMTQTLPPPTIEEVLNYETKDLFQ